MQSVINYINFKASKISLCCTMIHLSSVLLYFRVFQIMYENGCSSKLTSRIKSPAIQLKKKSIENNFSFSVSQIFVHFLFFIWNWPCTSYFLNKKDRCSTILKTYIIIYNLSMVANSFIVWAIKKCITTITYIINFNFASLLKFMIRAIA